MNLNNHFRKKYPQLEYLFISGNIEKIFLSQIVIKPEFRETGFGSKIMKDLVDYADKTSSIIYLSPDNCLGASSVTRLVNFYKRFGFVMNKGKNKDFTTMEAMLRRPKSKELNHAS